MTKNKLYKGYKTGLQTEFVTADDVQPTPGRDGYKDHMSTLKKLEEFSGHGVFWAGNTIITLPTLIIASQALLNGEIPLPSMTMTVIATSLAAGLSDAGASLKSHATADAINKAIESTVPDPSRQQLNEDGTLKIAGHHTSLKHEHYKNRRKGLTGLFFKAADFVKAKLKPTTPENVDESPDSSHDLNI